METLQKQNSFRNSYINNVTALFRSAENMARDSEARMNFNKKNYKGQLLDEKNQTEKQLRQKNLETLCSQIKILKDRELELLSKKKEHELQNPCKDILENLASLKDIITKEELQFYADKYKDSGFVQRRVNSIAEERHLYIHTYPGFDKKMNAVKEVADAFVSFIKYNNFGMEPAIYEKTTLQEYDNILEPISGGAE